jgi:butyrate kinase
LKKLYGEGGMYAYLGTKDVREVLARIIGGDKKAKLILDAMIYQICKDIAAMASVIDFDTDGLILTGGLAQSEYICRQIKKRVGRAMKIYIYPGSSENEALAENALRVLNKEEKCLKWPVKLKMKSML